ncbi:MAG: glycosyltransferase family 4 protein, partial [Alkalispirochaeta sp.]
TAAAFRITETADLLVELGHEVTVITSEPHRAQAGGGDPGSAVRLYRVPIDPLSGGGIKPYLKHFFSFVFRARRCARDLIRKGYRPDVAWVSSPPLFVGLVGTAIRRWSKAPLILDIRDVWPDTAVAAGQLTADGRAYRIGRKLEHWLYRRADGFSCVAAPMADYIRQEVAALGKTTPVEVVYNGAGFDVDPPVPSSDIKKTVLYAGNLGRLQGIDAFVSAWAAVNAAERQGWVLELIGTGVMEAELRQQVAELGIEDTVRFRGVLPKDQTIQELRRASVLFLNLLARPVFDLTIPSKLFDYLATGRPIIGGISGEGQDILSRLPGNRTVSPNDAAAITKALRDHITAGSWNKPAPENQRIVSETYSRRVSTGRLERLFNQVCQVGRTGPGTHQ